VAFRSFAHWTSSEPRARARRVVTRLRCIGPLDADDVAEIRRMPHLRDLVLEGLEAFPPELCGLAELRSLTVNGRGEAGITALPEEIGRLSSLRTLRVRARRMTTLPDSIVDLARLVELDLRHSGVRKLPDRFLELPELRRVLVAH
jgi:hypothetical protein